MIRTRFISTALTLIFTVISTIACVPGARAWTDGNAAISVLSGTGDESGYAITLDGSSNILSTGVFRGVVDFDPGSGVSNLTPVGGDDVYISKLDSSGNYLWAKAISGIYDESVNSIAVDSSGNVYITGGFYGTVDFDPSSGVSNLISNRDSADIYILKLDSNGAFLWAKSFGSRDDEFGYSLVIDSSGNVLTTGSFNRTIDFDLGAGTANLVSAGWTDSFLLKLDSSGNYVWAKRMGSGGFDSGLSIALDAAGNIFSTGYFSDTTDFDPGAGTANLTSVGQTDIYISKLDSSGNYIWAKSYGGANYDNGSAISVDGSGNVYTAGYFSTTTDFDPGIGTSSLTPVGAYDGFLSKFDSSGNFIWVKAFGGTGGTALTSVATDRSGNILTTGYFEGSTDFDPNAGNAAMTSAGLIDLFVSKFDTSGNYLWAKSAGGIGEEWAISIAVDEGGNAYTTGYFENSVDFDPGAGTASVSASGLIDAFIFRLSSSGEAVSSSSSGSSSDSSTNASAAATAAAAAIREAAKQAARAELIVGFKDGKPATAQKFAAAGINGVTASNIEAVNGEIALLPEDSRTSVTEIMKVARKFEVVGMIASSQINLVFPTYYVEVNLIPAQSKNKTALVNAVKRLEPSERNSYEAIKSAIAAETEAIAKRAMRLALVISRNSNR